MITDARKPLLQAIKDAQDADEALRLSWQYKNPFRDMLMRNLDSKDRIFEAPSEDFPRPRCYRGTGYKCRLVKAVYYKNEDKVRIEFETDYVEAGVDSFMESEGCPGAEVKAVRHEIVVPCSLLENPTKTAFKEWADKFRINQQASDRGQAIEDIKAMAKRVGLKVDISTK